MNEQQQQQETNLTVQKAEALIITNNADYEAAGTALVEIKTYNKRVQDYWKEPKDNAYKAWKGICAKEKVILDPLNEAEGLIKQKMATYQREQEAKERAIREELERRQREETERLMKEAEEKEKEAEESKKKQTTQTEQSSENGSGKEIKEEKSTITTTTTASTSDEKEEKKEKTTTAAATTAAEESGVVEGKEAKVKIAVRNPTLYASD
jgi:Mg-chelatase subunit ChlI